jgi:hypothetical protein
MHLAAAALSIATVLGCDPPPTQIPPGPGAAPSRPIEDRPMEPPPAAPIELSDSLDAGAGPSEGGPAGGEEAGPVASAGGETPAAGGTGTGMRDGGACESGDQCASGICEGQGCGADRKGVCMSQNRRCTRDLRAYCGCDGQTFRASGSCPGRRYSARAACK